MLVIPLFDFLKYLWYNIIKGVIKLKYNSVKTFKDLLSIRKDIGDIVYCEEEKRAYTYTNNHVWEPCTVSGEGLSLSLFDLNAQAIASLPAANEDFLYEMADAIDLFATNTHNTYYMLMCKQQSYYTILHYDSEIVNDFANLGAAVITLAKELGEIKDVYPNENSTNFDIWVKVNNDMWCMHLFPYDAGVVCYG